MSEPDGSWNRYLEILDLDVILHREMKVKASEAYQKKCGDAVEIQPECPTFYYRNDDLAVVVVKYSASIFI